MNVLLIGSGNVCRKRIGDEWVIEKYDIFRKYFLLPFLKCICMYNETELEIFNGQVNQSVLCLLMPQYRLLPGPFLRTLIIFNPRMVK